MRRFLSVFLIVIAVCEPAQAQSDRYDAGRRLIAFEKAWDEYRDTDARKRSIPFMKSALNNFFANKYGEAARYLDAARNSLASAEPPVAGIAWAESLSFRPDKRFVEQFDPEIRLGIKQLYNLDSSLPGRFRLSVKLMSSGNITQLHQVEAQTCPPQVTFGLNGTMEGDHRLEVGISSAEQQLARFAYQLSVVKNRDQRLAALRMALEKLPTEGLTTEQRTLNAHVSTLVRLASNTTLETDYPAYRLMVEAEQLAGLPRDAKYFDSSKTGEFWMTLSTAKGEAPVRVFVPPQAKEGRPLPLVVAMHGAGGTENMFFDAYGHGEVVRQCEKRGWILVAPRANFIGSAPIAAIVDELATRYPVDTRRLFLVGHSMGAGQAMALAQQSPDRWAGVAALGGSSRVSKPDVFRQVPLYIGCGTEDFALPGARAATKLLMEADAKHFVSKEYPDIEHIVIVQVALPDVFQWYETLPSR